MSLCKDGGVWPELSTFELISSRRQSPSSRSNSVKAGQKRFSVHEKTGLEIVEMRGERQHNAIIYPLTCHISTDLFRVHRFHSLLLTTPLDRPYKFAKFGEPYSSGIAVYCMDFAHIFTSLLLRHRISHMWKFRSWELILDRETSQIHIIVFLVNSERSIIIWPLLLSCCLCPYIIYQIDFSFQNIFLRI